MMDEIVGVECNSFVYEIKSLLNTAGKITRFKIKNNRDAQFALGGADGIPEVYVIVKPYQKSSQQPSQSLHEPIHQTLGQQNSFLQLMIAQFASTHGSNRLFHPNMWNQTCHP